MRPRRLTIGSDADDFRIIQDEGLILNDLPQRNRAPDPPRSASGEARGTYCLLRDRKTTEIKRGRIIRRACDFEPYQP